MDDLLATIEKLQTPSAGAHIVAVSTRDSLGWPTRARTAAAGAALTAAARSLALQLAPQRITVNLVAALPPATSPLRDTLPAQATCLSEPAELTGDAITIDDIADMVEFFLHPRSRYITGQVLYGCGGASLLSSLSV